MCKCACGKESMYHSDHVIHKLNVYPKNENVLDKHYEVICEDKPLPHIGWQEKKWCISASALIIRRNNMCECSCGFETHSHDYMFVHKMDFHIKPKDHVEVVCKDKKLANKED